MSNKVRFAKVAFMLIFAVSICSFVSFAYTLPGLALSNLSPVHQNHPDSNCPAIPAHFDFLHASKQELHHYGILSRPRTRDQYTIASWLKEVQGIKKTVCLSQACAQPAMFHPGVALTAAPTTDTACENPPAGTECTANWTGYVEGNGTQPGFNDIYAYWNVPCVTTSKSSDSAVSTWVGLGGGFFSGDSNLFYWCSYPYKSMDGQQR